MLTTTRSDFQVELGRVRGRRGRSVLLIVVACVRALHVEVQLHGGVLQLPGELGEVYGYCEGGGGDEGAV